MDDDFYYHWTNKEGIEKLKKDGIRGEEGWFYTLHGNETGGLYEYVIGRISPGETAYGIRVSRDTMKESDCFLDKDDRIGDPIFDQMQSAKMPCRHLINKICGVNCDPNEPFEDKEDYWDWIGSKFEQCKDEKTDERSKKRIDCHYHEFLDAFVQGNRCNIKPEDIEFTTIHDPRSVDYSKALKLEWKKLKEED